jgi:hypothetical protein
MFRKTQADEIAKFFAQTLNKDELAVYYLGVSGFLARSSKHPVMFDPAGFLKNDEVKALGTVDVMLFTQ